MTNERRYMMVEASSQCLAMLMTHGTRVAVESGLPECARVIAVVAGAWDQAHDMVRIVVEHPSFEPVAEGSVVPKFVPVFRNIE